MTSSSSTEQTENGTDETGEDAVDASETNKSEDEETQSKSESDRTVDNKEKDKGADASADKKNEAKAPDASSEKPVQSQQTKPADKAPPVQSPAVSTDSTTSAVLTSPAVQDNTAAGKMTEEQYNTRVSELVAKMYSIKADFITQLSAFESRIISEYKALPKEQRTSATKTRIVSENMSYVMGLEAQCDAQVKAVTDELTAIMTANGKPTTLVDQINAAYVSEKEIKKAYYVSLYK